MLLLGGLVVLAVSFRRRVFYHHPMIRHRRMNRNRHLILRLLCDLLRIRPPHILLGLCGMRSLNDETLNLRMIRRRLNSRHSMIFCRRCGQVVPSRVG